MTSAERVFHKHVNQIIRGGEDDRGPGGRAHVRSGQHRGEDQQYPG